MIDIPEAGLSKLFFLLNALLCAHCVLLGVNNFFNSPGHVPVMMGPLKRVEE